MKKFIVIFVLLFVSSFAFAQSYYYHISSGLFEAKDNNSRQLWSEYCYSGYPGYKNDPSKINVENYGPIPVGTYYITGVRPNDPKGANTIVLRPDNGNSMFGRHSFLIHGDSKAEPGSGSQGCIIMGLNSRNRIAGEYAAGYSKGAYSVLYVSAY
jgi:hypothetical protein